MGSVSWGVYHEEYHGECIMGVYHVSVSWGVYHEEYHGECIMGVYHVSVSWECIL